MFCISTVICILRFIFSVDKGRNSGKWKYKKGKPKRQNVWNVLYVGLCEFYQ